MFGHENFRRDQPELLRNITRRRPKPQPAPTDTLAPGTTLAQKAVVELGNYGIEGEVKALKRDKDLLIKELVVTRQAEEKLRNKCDNLESRLDVVEKSSMQMQAFIMHYFSQVLQPYSDAMASRKRKRLTSSSSSDMIDVIDNNIPMSRANQVQPIAHPPPPESSLDALRVMMQQMQMNISRQPSANRVTNSSPAQSPALVEPPSAVVEPARTPRTAPIAFAPATVQELPTEDLPAASPRQGTAAAAKPGVVMKQIASPILSRPTIASFEATNGNASSGQESRPLNSPGGLPYEVFGLLEDIPSTPESSFTMDAIESALKDTGSKANGTHLDTPDYDDKDFEGTNGQATPVDTCEQSEKAIEDFLDLNGDETPLPPPLTHLPEGTDVHALAMRIEGMMDPEKQGKSS